jgi:hypothetical protein
MKTLRTKYLDMLKKNREADGGKLSFHDLSLDRFTRQLNDYYLPRSAGYLGNAGCYRTARKQGAQ